VGQREREREREMGRGGLPSLQSYNPWIPSFFYTSSTENLLFLVLNLYCFLMWMSLFFWFLTRKWKSDHHREVQMQYQDQINEATRKIALQEAEDEAKFRAELAQGKSQGVVAMERKAEERFGNMEMPEMTPQAAQLTVRKLFQEGEELLEKGDKDGALQSFLACILGFQKHRVPFRKLAQCINHISSLYFEMECYEEAVKYQQAERFIYEEALLNMTAAQQAADRKAASKAAQSSSQEEDGKGDADDGISIASASTHDSERFDAHEHQHPLLRRAEEFDRLSKVFGEEKNHALALDYAAKAVRLRQVARNEETITDSSYLETFLRQYAEMGREQYQSTLDEYQRRAASTSGVIHEGDPEEGMENGAASSSSAVASFGSDGEETEEPSDDKDQ